MTTPSTNQHWLALTAEAPLEPDLPICDPHHHLWDMRPTRVSERYLLDGFGWHERARPPTSTELTEATRAFYEFTLEKFGVDRCMFESNFPVDKVTCSYVVLWNSFKRLTAGYSAAEKAKLFHDTAARVYRLDNFP